MRKTMLFILALVLFLSWTAVAAHAQEAEQELVSIPALAAGFGPSLEAANLSFRLAAYAMDAQGSKISCADMARFAGKEFFIPRSALSLSVADLRSAYSACLVQAHAGLRPAPATTAKTATTTSTSTATTKSTPTIASTTTTTTTTSLSATELNKLQQLLRTAERRIEEVRAEEREAAEKRMNAMKAELRAEFERQLAAAQAAAETTPDPKLTELKQRVRDLEDENETLRRQLQAKGGPPSPSWDWDGFLKTAGLKHMARRVVVDPEVKKRVEEAQKRITEQQAKGRTSPCALLLSTPSAEMPDNFSLFGGLIDVSRADYLAAAENPAREALVLAWNPLAIAGYGLLLVGLTLAWPGYRALRRFLNPVGEIKIPKPKPVDPISYKQMRADPVWGLKGPELVEVIKTTLKGFDDVICFSFVADEVWIRADKPDRLNKAVRVLTRAHPSLIPGEARMDGGGYPYVIFTKYHNSKAPGDATKAS